MKHAHRRFRMAAHAFVIWRLGTAEGWDISIADIARVTGIDRGTVRKIARADDERLLDWLDRRTRGASSAGIARLYGVTSAKVRVATNRVREADSRESGEDTSGGYWGGAA